MNLEAFILGSGGMMPLPHRHLTSVLLRREGQLFLFDCGEGTQVSLRRLNLRWKKISVIFVSHTHADHVTGIPGMLMLSSQVDREEPLYIIGPPKIKEYIETSRRVLDMYINYEIHVHEITEEGTVYTGDGFKVEAFPLNHTKPCYGYTFIEDERPGVFHPEKAEAMGVPRGPKWSQLQNGESVKGENGDWITSEHVMGPPRKGRKFSFVTDTTYKPQIAERVSNSDLLVCEAMFTKDLEESAREKKHMTAEQAGRIGRDGNVRRMELIHYSPRYTERDLKALKKEAAAVFSNTHLSRDRKVITIPFIE